MVRVGIVGIGFMGMIHYLAAKQAGLKVTAIATRDPKKLAGDWTSIQGNFGPRGKQEDLTGVACYEDYRALLEDPNVDLVDICLPNAKHHDVTIDALESGKDVLVEKAIALTVDDADNMLACAQKNNKLLMVAHVLPFFPEFAYALKTIRSKEFGAVTSAHFRRHISPPDWSADIADASASGGPVVDLHIHDSHFVRLAFGQPDRVESTGVVRAGVARYVSTNYIYTSTSTANPAVVSATSGAISHKARPFTHGFEINFEQATVFYEAGSPLTLYSDAGVTQPPLGDGDPIACFAQELRLAAEGVANRKAPDELSAQVARDALALCLQEVESAIESAV